MLHSNPSLGFQSCLKSLVSTKPAPGFHRQVYYGYARQALEDAFQIMGLQPGDGILYPDYICDVTLVPCHRLGLKVHYYPVKSDFQPDWGVLESLINDSIKAVLSVNFFGFPASFEKWREVVNRHNIWWVEDNAHGYGGLYRDKELGSFGDISVACLRKVLPLVNGASLQINSKTLASRMMPLGRLRYRPGAEECWRLAGYVLRWTKLPWNRFNRHAYHQMTPSDETDRRPRQMDLLSQRLMQHMAANLEKYRYIRRRAYCAWHNFSIRKGLEPVFNTLPAGTSPLVYPCYAANIRARDRWLDWGKKHLVDIHTWPSLPQALRVSRAPSIRKWEKLLCFPVHQDVSVQRDIYPLAAL